MNILQFIKTQYNYYFKPTKLSNKLKKKLQKIDFKKILDEFKHNSSVFICPCSITFKSIWMSDRKILIQKAAMIFLSQYDNKHKFRITDSFLFDNHEFTLENYKQIRIDFLNWLISELEQ